MAYLNPSEVLEYLNELGYTNITQLQLKDFMIDLKKLMKHDARSFDDVDNINLQGVCDVGAILRNPPKPHRDVFEDLYSTGTVASNAKQKQYKESLITLQINRPKKMIENRTPDSPTKQSEVSIKCSRKTSGTINPNCCCSCSQPATARSCHTYTVSRESEKSDKETTQRKTKIEKKPSKSFIRPRLNTKPPKSDPVALYHQYQQLWKKQKFPGKDNHTDLRWAIREKMLSGDRFDYCY